MGRNEQWRQAISWFDGIPYLLVFDPKAVVTIDPLTWWSIDTNADTEEREVLELAKRLAMLKRSRKH